jgi:hypothetical protein
MQKKLLKPLLCFLMATKMAEFFTEWMVNNEKQAVQN